MPPVSIEFTNLNDIRDLKPENVLLLNDEYDSPIKIIDFGLSRVFGDDIFDIEFTQFDFESLKNCLKD